MSKIIDFFMLVGSLKKLQRAGWVRHNIQAPESVADHMYRMSIMSFFVKENPQPIDREKCMKMALVHDMAESIIGDITPFCGVSKEDKQKMEREAMIKVCDLAGDEVGKELYALWEEYEECKTPEAKLVKDFDIADMLLQAFEYEGQEKRPFHLEEFFNGSSEQINNPEVLKWVMELHKRRGVAPVPIEITTANQ